MRIAKFDTVYLELSHYQIIIILDCLPEGQSLTNSTKNNDTVHYDIVI